MSCNGRVGRFVNHLACSGRQAVSSEIEWRTRGAPQAALTASRGGGVHALVNFAALVTPPSSGIVGFCHPKIVQHVPVNPQSHWPGKHHAIINIHDTHCFLTSTVSCFCGPAMDDVMVDMCDGQDGGYKDSGVCLFSLGGSSIVHSQFSPIQSNPLRQKSQIPI